mgnify:FL=1
MITASKLQSLVTHNEREILLYGYTLDRDSTYVFFLGNKIVRVEEQRGHGHNPDTVKRWMESEYIHPVFFQNVKRWYRGATNPTLRDYVESFYGPLSETDGGERMFGQEYYMDRPEDDRLIDLDE